MATLHRLAWLGRVLWASRISVLNAVLSVFVFGFAIQAQNLMADLSSMGNGFAEFFFWAGVFFFTFLLWAFPVHYGARRTLDDPSWVLPHALYVELKGRCADKVHLAAKEHELLIRWVPRLLGLVPFLALALGIKGALDAIAGANELPETALTRQQGHWLLVADAVTATAFLGFVCARKRLFSRVSGDYVHPVAAIVTAALFVIAYVKPIETSVILPRALIVPLLFGSLVLPLSYLQRLGHRTGVPYLTVLTLLVAGLTGLNVELDRIRTVPPKRGDEGRLTVAEAFAKWRRANPCDGGVCPRPIVVAIDGGASRAAFTAATFIGTFFDLMPEPKAKGEALSPGRRIFAISGVSGGSYGASIVQSALADSQFGGPSKTPPCRSAQSTWFGFKEWNGQTFTWRQCLQALTSGDNLSATIVGLAFRDYIAPPWQAIGLPAMRDRAALLEMTFEQQYSATLTQGLHFFEAGRFCGSEAGTSGLCRPAAHPKAFFDAHEDKDDPAHEKPGVWMPMLLLNGTSVATGRRIISSDFVSTPGGALYGQAYDLREAMSKACDHAQPIDEGQPNPLVGMCDKERIEGPDVRLSTAAVLSARFPFISPAGVFDMHDDANKPAYGDQIVDGGYFENSGLTSALDIVAALPKDARPILVSISNDPARNAPAGDELIKCAEQFAGRVRPNAALANCTGLPRRQAKTPRVLPDDNTFMGRIFGLLSRPFQTLVATGNGHADEAFGVANATPGFRHLQVEVAPHLVDTSGLPLATDTACQKMAGKAITMANVSMSWWLSASVQADLDIQRCAESNQKALAALLADAGASAQPPPR